MIKWRNTVYTVILQLCFLIWISFGANEVSQAQPSDVLGIGDKVVQLSNQLTNSWGKGKKYLQILHFTFQANIFPFTDSIFVSVYDDNTRHFVIKSERMLDDGKHWDLKPKDLTFGFVNRTDLVFTRDIEMHLLYPDSFAIVIRAYSPSYTGGPPIPFIKYPVKGDAVIPPQVRFQWIPVIDNVDSGGIIIWDSEPTVEGINDHIIYRQEVEVSSGNLMIDLTKLNLEEGKTYYWALWYFRGLRFFDNMFHFPGYAIELSSFSIDNGNVAQIPQEFKLIQSYPNPFNHLTILEWYQSHSNMVQLTIYNLTGQQIKKLTHQWSEAGIHLLFWDGTNELGNRVPSGAYFIVAESLNRRILSKVMLLK
jgi:FlgD Ig-like domain